MSAPLVISIQVQGANQAVTAVHQVQSQFASFQQTLRAGFNLNLGAKLAEAAIAAVRGLGAAMSEGLQYAAGLKDMSIQTGLTAEAVQVLGHAAAQSGGGIENVRAALMHLRSAATAAQGGNESMAESFRRLGVDARTITDLPLAAQLEAVARGFAASAGDGRSFAALVEVLGQRDVPRLQGLLQELARSGLGGMADALRANGSLLTSELVDKADEIDDRWGDLRVKMKATFAQMGIALKPFIDMLQWLLDVGLGALSLVVQAFQGLANALGAVAAVVAGASWKEAWEMWLKMANQPVGNVAGSSGPGSSPASPGKGSSEKGAGSSLKEILAEQNQLLLAQQPLYTQRAAAMEALRQAEAALQKVMADGNAKQLVDTQALAAAGLVVTRAKITLAKVDEALAASWERQAAKAAQITDLEISLLPLSEQRAAVAARLVEAESAIAAIYSAEVIDLNKLTDAELQRLKVKKALADIDAQLLADKPTPPKPAGADPNSFSDQLRAMLDELPTAAQIAADTIRNIMGSAISSISDGIYGWVTGAQSFGAAMLNLGENVLRTVLTSIVQIGVQMVANSLLRRALNVSEEKQEKASLATLAVKAGLKALGQLGPIWGTVAFAAALAGVIALTKGFSAGGYTGDMPANQVAGIVHGQEGVLNAPAMRRLGIENLNALNAGQPISIDAAPTAFAASGAAASRESGRNTYVLIDRGAFARAMQEDSTAYFREIAASEMRNA